MTSSPALHSKSPLVLVADDDEFVREAIADLLRSVGLETRTFDCAEALFDSGKISEASCLVLDVRMPGTSGLELQRRLAATDNHKPIIFVTAYGDIAMSVEAMKAGAFDFLEKPFREQALLDAVHAAVEREASLRAENAVRTEAIARYQTLTPREAQVMREVSLGQLNKQIADTLNISEITVKLHRGNVMRKMGAATIGELIRVWELIPSSLKASPLPSRGADDLPRRTAQLHLLVRRAG